MNLILSPLYFMSKKIIKKNKKMKKKKLKKKTFDRPSMIYDYHKKGGYEQNIRNYGI